MRACGELFWSMSQWLQINFIYTNNVRILYLSCNVNKHKTAAKLSEKECPLPRPRLYGDRFLPSVYMNQVPEKLYFVQNNTEIVSILY